MIYLPGKHEEARKALAHKTTAMVRKALEEKNAKAKEEPKPEGRKAEEGEGKKEEKKEENAALPTV